MAHNFVNHMLKKDDAVIEEVVVNTSKPNLEVMALKVRDELFIWIFNKDDSILNHVDIALDDFPDGKYLMKTYNTWTGKYSDSTHVKIFREKFEAKHLELKGNMDMALWLKPID